MTISDADLIKLRRELRRRGKMLLSCEASAELILRHREKADAVMAKK